MLRIQIIGAGRAGGSLARALQASRWPGIEVVGPLTREQYGPDLTTNPGIVVLAVPDGEIARVATYLTPGPAVVVHVAGSLGLDVLAPHARRAALHPVLAMPDATTGAGRLPEAWWAVTGDPEARVLVEALRGRAVEVPDELRAAHHAACTVASNHVMGNLGLVAEIAPEAAPLDMYLRLARGSVELASAMGPMKGMTGPVSRGDWATLRRHLAALPAGPREAYRAGARQVARLLAVELPADIATSDSEDLAPAGSASPSASPASAPAPATRAAEATGASGAAEASGAAGTPATSGTPATESASPVAAGAPVVIHTKAELRAELARLRAAGHRIGLVPTMGALHEGHTSLIDASRANGDTVVMTIFVNPLQFSPTEDLSAYPRTLASDLAMAAAHGVAVVFAPTVEEMYGPDGQASIVTRVHVEGLADRLEGASRPGHFDGVATVVTKLFNLVGQCRAYFGEKDFQQLQVIRTFVRDLDLPVEVIGCPTRRTDTGVALSSRNVYLSAEEWVEAPALRRSLQAGAKAVEEGEADPVAIRAAIEAVLRPLTTGKIDRIDVVDADTLAELTPATTQVRLLVAVRFGRARLIDNMGVQK